MYVFLIPLLMGFSYLSQRLHLGLSLDEDQAP